MTRPIIILAGGTGGHIFPGLVVARELLAAGVPVVPGVASGPLRAVQGAQGAGAMEATAPHGIGKAVTPELPLWREGAV